MIKKVCSFCFSHMNRYTKKLWPSEFPLVDFVRRCPHTATWVQPAHERHKELLRQNQDFQKMQEVEAMLLEQTKNKIVPEYVAKRGIKKKTEGTYHIRTLTSKDKDNTIDFLNRLFFRDEPINKAVKLLEGPNERCEELEEYVMKVMDDGISVAAVDDKDKLVGVIINGLVRRGAIEKITNIKSQKFRSVQRVLAHLDKESRLWEKLPKNCNLVVDLKIASTDPEWRGRKIMEALSRETDRLAKKHGACAIRMDATSIFSAKVAERLGYEKIYCVLFDDIVDGPQPLPPHIEACVYLKKYY